MVSQPWHMIQMKPNWSCPWPGKSQSGEAHDPDGVNQVRLMTRMKPTWLGSWSGWSQSGQVHDQMKATWSGSWSGWNQSGQAHDPDETNLVRLMIWMKATLSDSWSGWSQSFQTHNPDGENLVRLIIQMEAIWPPITWWGLCGGIFLSHSQSRWAVLAYRADGVAWVTLNSIGNIQYSNHTVIYRSLY